MLKRSLYLFVAAVCVLSVRLHAQQLPSSLAAEQQRIYRELAAEQRAFDQAHEKAVSDEERNKLKFPDRDKYAGQMVALAEKYIKDPAAVNALIWALINARDGSEPVLAALALLQKHYLESDRMETVCVELQYDHSAATTALLNDLLTRNPHPRVKGAAALTLGQIYVATEDPRQAERYFGEVEKHGTPAQIESARGHLFELKNLGIGKVAPDIAGEDVDGKKFKLSDYRGKVVLLDFWGDW
jgi:hypothetical protein